MTYKQTRERGWGLSGRQARSRALVRGACEGERFRLGLGPSLGPAPLSTESVSSRTRTPGQSGGCPQVWQCPLAMWPLGGVGRSVRVIRMDVSLGRASASPRPRDPREARGVSSQACAVCTRRARGQPRRRFSHLLPPVPGLSDNQQGQSCAMPSGKIRCKPHFLSAEGEVSLPL